MSLLVDCIVQYKVRKSCSLTNYNLTNRFTSRHQCPEVADFRLMRIVYPTRRSSALRDTTDVRTGQWNWLWRGATANKRVPAVLSQSFPHRSIKLPREDYRTLRKSRRSLCRAYPANDSRLQAPRSHPVA